MRVQRNFGAAVILSLALLAPLSMEVQRATAEPQALASAGFPVSPHTLQGRPRSDTHQDSLQIVVRFKDDSRVTAIIATYWKDPGAARARFNEFKSGWPELAPATLVRATYSNELVLEFPFGSTEGEARSEAARDLATRLSRLAGIVYAEPDLTFSTQQD